MKICLIKISFILITFTIIKQALILSYILQLIADFIILLWGIVLFIHSLSHQLFIPALSILDNFFNILFHESFFLNAQFWFDIICEIELIFVGRRVIKKFLHIFQNIAFQLNRFQLFEMVKLKQNLNFIIISLEIDQNRAVYFCHPV